jgi:hypothetical protein
MTNEESVTATELEIIEPIGETCMMSAQIVFDAAIALL